MINAVGREIPEEVLAVSGKDIFRGSFYHDNREICKGGTDSWGIM